MREPDFMPSWYSQLLRRRRLVVMEAWVLGAVAAGLIVWGIYGQHQLHEAEGRLSSVRSQLVQTGVDLQHLNDIETVKQELEHQDQIVRHLGVHIPASKMLEVVDELMPHSMALNELDMDTVEIPEVLTETQHAAGIKPRMTRKLQVRLDGLAPTYVELGTFMTSLVAEPYITDVALVRATDSAQEGHLMRTFEVTFALDLGTDDSGAQVATAGGQ
ncbi:MAG TPA: PilN domain-containing protein [Tepidisphaeraceae bacterium]|nr:PilN domain-containing protein [Tepidisphaeraceae bacterium]